MAGSPMGVTSNLGFPSNPVGSEGVDAQGRSIWGGYVQDVGGGWIKPSTGSMDFGRTDITPGTASPVLNYDTNTGQQGTDGYGRAIWGGYVQDTNGAWVTPQPKVPLGGTDMNYGLPDISGGLLQPSANTPNNVGGVDGMGRPIWGGYVQDPSGAWVLPAPSSYDQGTSYGGSSQGNLNFNNTVGMGVTGTSSESANNPNNVGGILGGSSPVGGTDMGFGLTDITGGGTGSGGIDSQGRTIWGGYVQAGDGTWVLPDMGGYDAGDMGDAATTQGHTDYMNAARAAAAKEAEYQSRVRAEREAIDASIAWAAAQANSWNPQYNGQVNFNNNVFAQNPTNIYDRWASGQSTQYQPY